MFRALRPISSSLAAAVLVAVLGACGSGPAAPGAPRPHVLLISIDTLRPDRLGCYGHDRDTSPTLDALAARGVVFEDVTSASPWTLPSHASLLTGLYPSHHGLKTHERKLREELPTLASTLRAAGYETAAVVNSHNVSGRYGLDQGFDRFQYLSEVSTDGSIPNRGAQVLYRARKILERRGERPLFMFLHFYDVHTDFVVAPEYRERFVRPYEGPLDGSTRQLSSIRERNADLDLADVRHLFDLYDAEIRQLDDLLAGFLDELDQAGLLQDTLVAVVSDHGEEFMEHGSVLHGRTYYQEVLRVPWILAGPGVPRGERVEFPVHLVDVMPTLLELAAVPPPGGQDALDGVSLAPLLEGGPAPEDRVLFAEADHNNAEPDIRRLVRTPRYKLIYDRLVQRAELFDLEHDPAELRDLLDEEPELVEVLMERLRAFMAGEREADVIEGPDADTLEALRKLGY